MTTRQPFHAYRLTRPLRIRRRRFEYDTLAEEYDRYLKDRAYYDDEEHNFCCHIILCCCACDCRCTRRRLFCFAFTLVLLFVLLYSLMRYYEYYGVHNFERAEAEAVLTDLCTQFHKGHYSGKLCNKLCFDHRVTNWTILDYYNSTKLVLRLKNGFRDDLVLKVESSALSDLEKPSMLVTETQFLEQIREVVESDTLMGWVPKLTPHLITLLWPDYDRFSYLSEEDRHALYSLAQQSEYVHYAVHKSAGLFPKLRGTCGPFYAVDYALTVDVDFSFEPHARSRLLMNLLGTLKLLQLFTNEPLEWCDVKFEHLGLSPDRPDLHRFILLDADLLFTQAKLKSIFAETECKSDEDCHFFDCHSRCDREKKRCLAERVNDNIEVFCRKLVFQLYGSFWSHVNKLLETCHFVDSLDKSQRLAKMYSAWSFTLTNL